MSSMYFVANIKKATTDLPACESLEAMEAEAKRLANKFKQSYSVLVEVKEVLPDDIMENIGSYEKACKYLGIFLYCQLRWAKGSSMFALYKLLTIAEAWNKFDGFLPDLSDDYQLKYFPMFLQGGKSAGSGSSYSSSTATWNNNSLISRWLCFETSGRAELFDKHFFDLWQTAKTSKHF